MIFSKLIYVDSKLSIIFLRHNVKDNKKSVIFVPSGKKNVTGFITVDTIYYYNV